MAPLRGSLRAALLVMVLIALLQPAQALLACTSTSTPDPRPLRLQLPELPLAFVGTVRSVGSGEMRWSVEQALRGALGREWVVARPPGDCAQPFRPGERWFFAGIARHDPSRRLGDAARPLSSHLTRLDDQRLALSAWQGCDDSAQCVAVDHGCTLTAAHRDHRDAASRQAWAQGGDPRNLSCVSRPLVETVLACVDQRCGAWQLTPTATPR